MHFLVTGQSNARRREEVVMGRRIGLLVSLVALLALGGGTLAATPAWAARQSSRADKLGPALE